MFFPWAWVLSCFRFPLLFGLLWQELLHRRWRPAPPNVETGSGLLSMHDFSSIRKQYQLRKSRPFGKLTIDTRCTNPGKPFPYESRVQELSFVSFEESKARKKAHAAGADEQAVVAKNIGLGQVTHKRGTVHGHVRTGTLEIVESAAESHHAQDTLKLPSNARAKGTRPSPLDFSQDISPSDRAITIGCAFSPSTVSTYTRSPSSAITSSRSPPRILITPAKDKFSPSDLPHDASYHRGYRPASSVYSRYTTCGPRTHDQKAPPVPPLPLFINTSNTYNYARRSAGTTFEEDLTPGCSDSAGRSVRLSNSLTAGLPTPRRSKGWWNVITSPFSARSGTGTFWRSPSLTEESVPVLDNAEAMASSDPHAGVIFTVRDSGDDALRTAPATGAHSDPFDAFRPLPIRSETAPGALDANIPTVNIYRIPSQGEAAAYYDPRRHFPSLCLESRSMSESPEDGLHGWSPSNSVYMPAHDSLAAQQRGMEEQSIVPDPAVDEANPVESASENLAGNDTALVNPAPSIDSQHPVCFSTPSEDELKSAGLSKPHNDRSFTQTTGFSVMSPLSATPVVQDAHLARFVGPQSSFGEQKTVEVERTPTQAGPPLAGATMAHGEEYRGEWTVLLSEKTATQVKHTRENSYGLGISDGDRELYPEPHHVSEKDERPRVYIDRFQQPTTRIVEEQRPRRPWYRRFLWFLIAVASALLVLLIVLLAVLIPRSRSGMAVEASWVNTTGFPAVTIGVLTVIQPKTQASSSCVAPPSLWTCAVPGLEETSLPNFRLEIRFRNGTLPKNETAQLASGSSRLIRKNVYSPSPAAPSEDDQLFMGRTTDNSSVPYDGEETPFYISLLDSAALQTTSAAQKRDSNYTYPYPSSETTAWNASTNAPDEIPSPSVKSNGQPTDEVLYPLVTSQPLRLFNRGEDTEHYGFYTYFDRSMYISGTFGSSTTNSTNITSNVALDNASAVCTWSQTRMLVQIWTKKGLENTVSALNTSVPAGNSTANDMTSPGSFPYPVTFKLDRHGGISYKKGVYCYGIDEKHKLISDGKLWIDEDRAAGGSGLVNPAQVPGSNSSSARKRGDGSDENETKYGGIDGGNGGCECQWQNWS